MNSFLSTPWLWVYGGVILMLLEIVVPGFILCFFGLAAVTVGLLRFVFADAFTPAFQMAAFSVFSVLYIVFLRRMFKGIFFGEKTEAPVDFSHELVGRTGRVTEAVSTSRPGRILLGDAEWTAQAAADIPVGADVRVVSQQNLTLTVEVCK